MNQILTKERLSKGVYRMRVRAPLIAEERQPGQFIILQLDTEFGERIPLTIADADAAEGSITIIFQAVGKSTKLLAQMNPGETDRQPGRPAGPADPYREFRNGGLRRRAASGWRRCIRSRKE